MRKTKLNPVTLANLGCFTPEQIEKIQTMEPDSPSDHIRSKFGKIFDLVDFSGLEIFNDRNK